jgi:hypothetical protein
VALALHGSILGENELSRTAARSLLALLAALALSSLAHHGAAAPAETRRLRISQLDRLDGRKARVTLVLGSFDWVHNGHRSLIETAAAPERAHDLALVMPVAGWSKKPALKASFPRRLRQLHREVQALKDEGAIDDRVLVSDAWKDLPRRPGDLLRDLIVVDRPGLRPNPRRIARLKDRITVDLREPRRPVEISTTEIKQALEAGDLARIEDRVPRGTLADLRVEFARLESQRSAAQKLIGGRSPTDKSFAQLREERPEGAIDLLEGVEEQALDEGVRQLLAGLQQRINSETMTLENDLRRMRFDHQRTVDKRFGYIEKFVTRTPGTRDAEPARYLFKKADPVSAAKQQAMSVLANLFGLETPLALAASFREPGATYTTVDGVALPWIDRLIPAVTNEQAAKEKKIPLYNFSRATARVLRYLFLGRFFDEACWLQDVWWADYNAPRLANGRHDHRQLIRFDFKMAWERRSAQTVREAVNKWFGFDAPLKVLRWTDRRLRWRERVGFKRKHWDSPFTMYGALLHAYVLGQTAEAFDLAEVKQQIRTLKRIPRRVLENVLRHYATAAAGPGTGWGWLRVQAWGRDLKPENFVKRAADRIQRNIEPYCAFLDKLARARDAARKGKRNRIVKFYRSIEKMDL